MDENTVFQRADNATFQVVAGEAIVIRMDTGAYYSLNEVGTDFWELLDGRTPLHQHAQAIADKYNQKTADFIAQLRQLAAGDGD
ncbi:MAG: PqqD family protein, partial [Anaerolineae bacterium]